jgi:hypothetical protein
MRQRGNKMVSSARVFQRPGTLPHRLAVIDRCYSAACGCSGANDALREGEAPAEPGNGNLAGNQIRNDGSGGSLALPKQQGPFRPFLSS